MNALRTGVLLAALTALFVVVGGAIGGQQGMIIALLVAAAMNLLAYWNSDRLVLRMHGARLVDPQSGPELYAMVGELAQRADVPMPKVYFIDTPQPNAFATGRNPQNAAVAVTRGLLENLSRDELAGVIAHELAHIKNRDTLTMAIAATIGGAVGMLANFGLFFGGRRDNGGNMLTTLAMVFLAPLAAGIVQMAISRTREFSADRDGAAISGRPVALAHALQRIQALAARRPMPSAQHNPATAHLFIVNPLTGHGFVDLFRTHPRTEERVRRLMAMANQQEHRPLAAGSSGPWG